MNFSELSQKLTRIERLLERLVAPVAAEEGRQLASSSPEQRKEHNAAVIQRAKEKLREAA